MNTVTKIACRTIGLAGMSAVLYDAYSVGKHYSIVGEKSALGRITMDAFAAKRTTTNESPVTSSVQNKVADFRMNNPLIPIAGRIKGFFKGTLSSLGDNIIPVAFSSMAVLGKNTWAKVGAWGMGGYAAFVILKEGFGVGK